MTDNAWSLILCEETRAVTLVRDSSADTFQRCLLQWRHCTDTNSPKIMKVTQVKKGIEALGFAVITPAGWATIRPNIRPSRKCITVCKVPVLPSQALVIFYPTTAQRLFLIAVDRPSTQLTRGENSTRLLIHRLTTKRRKMGTLGRAIYNVGFWIRETGQALDRLGCRLQGNYYFQEQCKFLPLCTGYSPISGPFPLIAFRWMHFSCI